MFTNKSLVIAILVTLIDVLQLMYSYIVKHKILVVLVNLYQ